MYVLGKYTPENPTQGIGSYFMVDGKRWVFYPVDLMCNNKHFGYVVSDKHVSYHVCIGSKTIDALYNGIPRKDLLMNIRKLRCDRGKKRLSN